MPSAPALAHAPLVLGLDAAGREHPQSPEYPDDEDLVGRLWGCACGWRGTVRDITGRPFHPRVGDGGGLRRQRLARSDRDSRPELEAHLARSTAAPADPSTPARPVPTPSAATTSAGHGTIGPDGPRPRGRRRRLTVPRNIPLAIPSVTPAAPGPADDELEAIAARDTGAEVAANAQEQHHPATAPSSGNVVDVPDRTPVEPAALELDDGSGARGSADLLAEAAARAESARVELADAETALDAAVAAARAGGLSWRSIGRATGLGHRDAFGRWGPPGGGPSL